jgi:hypothetical protein
MGEISGVLAKLEQVIERIEAIERRLDQPDVQIRSEISSGGRLETDDSHVLWMRINRGPVCIRIQNIKHAR